MPNLLAAMIFTLCTVTDNQSHSYQCAFKDKNGGMITSDVIKYGGGICCEEPPGTVTTLIFQDGKLWMTYDEKDGKPEFK